MEQRSVVFEFLTLRIHKHIMMFMLLYFGIMCYSNQYKEGPIQVLHGPLSRKTESKRWFELEGWG